MVTPVGRQLLSSTGKSRSICAGRNGPPETLAAEVQRKIKAATGVGAKVVVLADGSLPRATHKAKRVEDRRQGVWS